VLLDASVADRARSRRIRPLAALLVLSALAASALLSSSDHILGRTDVMAKVRERTGTPVQTCHGHAAAWRCILRNRERSACFVSLDFTREHVEGLYCSRPLTNRR
jgi:hypothetical protein